MGWDRTGTGRGWWEFIVVATVNAKLNLGFIYEAKILVYLRIMCDAIENTSACTFLLLPIRFLLSVYE